MKLTPEQLRQNAEALRAFADGKPIQCQFGCDGGGFDNEWHKTENLNRFLEVPHRPEPEPVTREWNSDADVPAGICFVLADNCKCPQLVTLSTSHGVWCSGGAFYYYRDLRKFSTDRKTWLPCTVTEAQ